MRYTKTDYPIGATWEFVNERGDIGRVWLKERNEFFEVWMWSKEYSDGSGLRFDWTTSRRTAIAECPIWSSTLKRRFKRVPPDKEQGW